MPPMLSPYYYNMIIIPWQYGYYCFIVVFCFQDEEGMVSLLQYATNHKCDDLVEYIKAHTPAEEQHTNGQTTENTQQQEQS